MAYAVSTLQAESCQPLFHQAAPWPQSDVKDAQWIAECTMKELIRGSFVPPETIQQLRQYDCRIFDLNEEIVRKLSELDAVLQRCNIRLSNYVSNVDSKSYKAVVRAISQGITAPEELVKLIHGRIINHHGTDVITASLKGVVSLAEIDMISQLRDELDMAEAHNDISIVSPMMPRFVPFTSILTVASPNAHRNFHTFGLGTTTMPGIVLSTFLLTSSSLSLIVHKLVVLS